MSKELNYMYSNKTVPETDLQMRIKQALAAKEKRDETRDQKLENDITRNNKVRLSDMSVSDMSFTDINILTKILKEENEDPKHYETPTEKRGYSITKTQNQRGDEFHDPHKDIQNAKLEKYHEALQRLKEVYEELINHPKIQTIEGATEKLGKIAEIMNRIESAFDENGSMTDKSITKAFKGYTRSKCCTENEKYIKKSSDAYLIKYDDYVVSRDGSQFSKNDLLEAREEINHMISDMDNFDRL